MTVFISTYQMEVRDEQKLNQEIVWSSQVSQSAIIDGVAETAVARR